MGLRTRIAGLAAGLMLTAVVAIPVLAEGSEDRRERADLSPDIQAALETARQERSEAREARAMVRAAAFELRNLNREADDTGDVEEERLAELEAEMERLRETAAAEGEEAWAAFATFRRMMEEAGLEPRHDRPSHGRQDGDRPGRGEHGERGCRSDDGSGTNGARLPARGLPGDTDPGPTGRPPANVVYREGDSRLGRNRLVPALGKSREAVSTAR